MQRESFPMRLFRAERLTRLYVTHRKKIIAAQFVLVFGLGILVSWLLGGGQPGASPDPNNAATPAKAEQGPTMWTCAMHPQIRLPKPGRCPICKMPLIPVTKTSGGMRTLTVSPEARALMSIETAPVERRYVTNEIRMVGKVTYDETRLGYITAWVSGRLDRLYVDYTGVEVKKGDHMVYIYSEELYSAQEELIQALKYSRQTGRERSNLLDEIDYVKAAREKLRLLGLTEQQIQQIEQRQKPSDHLTIYSPVSGIVIEKLRQEGERVHLGDRIYTIADLSRVWVHLDAYESDLVWLRYGQRVTITTESYPGESFSGRIDFIQPVLNDKTRTVKVRVNVANRDGKLKPEMFVHGVVRAKVATGGRVMDPELAGKWIGPMHPEIVKDEPGNCDICGMPLVRAESLGFVAAETDAQAKPLVIPKSAALVTGSRAIVYVQLPNRPSGLQGAFQAVAAAVKGGQLEQIRQAFTSLSELLDQPYDQPATAHAKQLWNRFAERLGQQALAGERVRSRGEAERTFAELEATMDELGEQFAPANQPTFEGREIVLGPRAGDYYLVRHGLQEGELVVTRGNFKIDSEIQIQAKPSMMTPEGGGGGGHHHGGGGAKQPGAGPRPERSMALPAEFSQQIERLDRAYQQVTEAVRAAELEQVRRAFDTFGEALGQVDGKPLTGHAKMMWKELAMLLGNDVVEGREVKQIKEADRVYLLLKAHMRRTRQQLGAARAPEPPVQRIEVAAAFQAQLAQLWKAYLPLQQALADDDFAHARRAVAGVRRAVAAVKDKSLSAQARRAWQKEQANLAIVLDRMQSAKDLEAHRAAFSLLSDEMSVLVRGFGFGDVGPVYQLHCPMAMGGRGAIWLQKDDEVRNPYYGSTMLQCADRVERVAGGGSRVEGRGSRD